MSDDYREIMQAEIKPDIYTDDGIPEPRWEAYAEGDMDSDTFKDPIVLECTQFPAGTRVVVYVPCCPECGQDVEMCSSDECCDFDWVEWVENKYS